ncbi:glycosyltransferase [Chitinophaga flava]|uniref:Glycosyltransferase 2-like domain-containing protein n=1 Tax=Chitinophaga flava TaxID=2259036 RepID=A0A365Y697_9BACT|nr:glycosyltransferase [Chitinophaga flava]RBL93858.1 hypothetical protein DF182_15305 [Chitinophaga flava]
MSQQEFHIGVSVIICCYNSAARLPLTLGHLQSQEVPTDFLWEIILVNNASTDKTVSLALDWWNKAHPPNAQCRIVDEPRPGQMHARKKGAQEARYECLLFCDDDNLLDKNYVFNAWQTLKQQKMAGAAGGQCHPVSDCSSFPSWFDTFKDKYAIGIPAETSGDVSHRGFVLGAGLVTRKSLFLSVFNERYPSLLNGRNGEKLSTGDDFEYCKRLLLWGYSLYYNEDLKLAHFIPKERLTLSYRDRLMEGIAAATQILTLYDEALSIRRKTKHKNKWRLLLLTPIRIYLARKGLSDRHLPTEQLVLFYLSPFNIKSDPVRTSIKKFLNKQ